MSLDGERSPKRQRLDSYSPASPPIAVGPETKPPFAGHPHVQTPPPSVHSMSPSWQQQQQQQPHAPSQPGGEGRTATFPTPPSTAGFGHPPQSSETEGAESGQATPLRDEGGGDTDMADAQHASADTAREAPDADHRRTDHDRQDGRPSPDEPMPTLPDLPPPPPRLYHLSTSPAPPIPRSQPHPTQNLLALYALHPLQHSVARRDAHGNKINKLRKSYEGKVKALGLQGSSKPSPGNNALVGLLDPEWDAVMPDGRTVWQGMRLEGRRNPLEEGEEGEAVAALLGRLGGALSGVRGGRLPREEDRKWEVALGLNEPRGGSGGGGGAGTKAEMAAGRTAGVNPALARTAPGQGGGARASAPASPAAARAAREGGRPERSGKKRRYDDDSFEGYTQTFAGEAEAGGGHGVSEGGGGGGGHGGDTGRGGVSTAASAVKRPRVEAGAGQQRRVGEMSRAVG